MTMKIEKETNPDGSKVWEVCCECLGEYRLKYEIKDVPSATGDVFVLECTCGRKALIHTGRLWCEGIPAQALEKINQEIKK